MKRTIVAIGGGENGRILEDGSYAPYETELIDKEIIKLTGKEKPNFLLIEGNYMNYMNILQRKENHNFLLIKEKVKF